MLRIILSISLTSTAAPALAHPGHIEAIAGHSHYVVVGALVVAAAIAAYAFGKVKSSRNV